MLFCKDSAYSFRYDAGSNPGALRLVVCAVGDSTGFANLQGYDIDRQAIRNFKRTEMKNLEEIQDVQIFDGTSLPKSISLDYVAQEFGNDGYTVWLDEDEDRVVAVKQNRDTFKTFVGRVGAVLELKGHGGSQLRLEIPTHGQGVCIRVWGKNGGNKQIANATVQEIITAMQQAIGP